MQRSARTGPHTQSRSFTAFQPNETHLGPPSSVAISEKTYDQSVRAFSPSGAIKQIEYAIQAAAKGSLAVALECSNGVVVGVVSRRRQSSLLVRPSIDKISVIDG